MLGKKENGALGSGNGQTLNTIIGRGTVFEGSMKVENSVRIDGVFKGELACSGALTISQTGEAHAQLQANEIYINGVVHGSVSADKIRLDSQARLVGDIRSVTLSIAEGAVFHGQCDMEHQNHTDTRNGADTESKNPTDNHAAPMPTIPPKPPQVK